MSKIKKRIIFILVLAIAIITSVFMLLSKDRNTNLIIPSHVPALHEYATVIPVSSDDTSKLDVSENGGGASVICSSSAKAHKKGNFIDFYYKNPSRSLATVVLQVKIEEEVISLSGAIPPGYETKTLDFSDSIFISKGTYKGTLVILFYDLTTGEKIEVDTEIGIPITIE